MYALALALLPVAVQIILLYAVSSRLNGLFYRWLGRTVYLLFMWPGVVVHELSHLFGCLITWTRVREANLFAPREETPGTLTLGSVVHDRPRSPVASTLIGSAPFFGGAAALWLLIRLLFPAVLAAASFSQAQLSGGSPGDLLAFAGRIAGEYLDFFFALAAVLASGGWRTLLFVYAAVPVAAHIAPSRPDLKHSLAGIFAVAVLLGLTAYIGSRWSPAWPGRLAHWLAAPVGSVTVLLAYGLACSLLGLIFFGGLALAISGLRRLWRRLRRA